MKAWSINKYNRLNGVLVTIHSYIVQAALSVPIKFRLEPLFSYSFDFDYMFAIQAMLQWSGREECGMGKCAVGLFSFSLNFMGLSWCNRKSVKALAFTYRRRYMRIVFSIIVFFFFLQHDIHMQMTGNCDERLKIKHKIHHDLFLTCLEISHNQSQYGHLRTLQTVEQTIATSIRLCYHVCLLEEPKVSFALPKKSEKNRNWENINFIIARASFLARFLSRHRSTAPCMQTSLFTSLPQFLSFMHWYEKEKKTINWLVCLFHK